MPIMIFPFGKFSSKIDSSARRISRTGKFVRGDYAGSPEYSRTVKRFGQRGNAWVTHLDLPKIRMMEGPIIVCPFR
jgi:hypothetical protein